MVSRFLLALLWFVLGVKSSLALGASCVELNRAWTERYRRDFKVASAGTNGEFRCSDETDYLLAEGIHRLYTVDSQHQFYVTARNLVRHTRFSLDCESSTAAWMSPTGTLTLCPRFLTLSVDRRAAVLFHESAHARPEDPEHVPCRAGELQGKLACDEHFTGGYTGGAYNWEVLYTAFAKQVATTEAAREDCRTRLRHLLTNRFNQISPDQLRLWLP